MDVRTRRDHDTLRLLGILRHGTHDQSSHGRKGPKAAVKAAAVKVAKKVVDGVDTPAVSKPKAVKKPRAPKKSTSPVKSRSPGRVRGRDITGDVDLNSLASVLDRTPAGGDDQALAKTAVKKATNAVAKAVTGEDALKAAPYRFGSGGNHGGFDGDEIDQAVFFYRGAGYMGINDDLRKGAELTGPWKQAAKRIDAAMGPLQSDVEVYRGIKNPGKVFGAGWSDTDVTGLEWRDGGYSSTTADTRLGQGSSFFSSSDGVTMRIVAPKGTRALAASDSGGEAELLLDRGLRFRVVADHGVQHGLRRLDVEVVSG